MRSDEIAASLVSQGIFNPITAIKWGKRFAAELAEHHAREEAGKTLTWAEVILRGLAEDLLGPDLNRLCADGPVTEQKTTWMLQRMGELTAAGPYSKVYAIRDEKDWDMGRDAYWVYCTVGYSGIDFNEVTHTVDAEFIKEIEKPEAAYPSIYPHVLSYDDQKKRLEKINEDWVEDIAANTPASVRPTTRGFGAAMTKSNRRFFESAGLGHYLE